MISIDIEGRSILYEKVVKSDVADAVSYHEKKINNNDDSNYTTVNADNLPCAYNTSNGRLALISPL